MAILEVVLNQRYANQLCVNRFHYVSSGTPAAVTLSFALISAMGLLEATGSPKVFPNETIGVSLQVCQNPSVEFLSTYARDLYSVTDFYESPYPSGVTGQKPGAGMSPLAALGFTASRVRTDIRRASKRFVGCNEEFWASGGILTGEAVALADDLAEQMSAVLSYDDEGNTITFTPAVLGYEKYTTDSGKVAYRPYATVSAQMAHVATGWQYQAIQTMRSQNSRQYGRGA